MIKRLLPVGVLAALTLVFSLLLSVTPVSLASVVIAVPGTKTTGPLHTGPPPAISEAFVDRQLHGYVNDQRYNPATGTLDPILIIPYGDEYPGSIGPLTGVGDPPMNQSVHQGVLTLAAKIAEQNGKPTVVFAGSQGDIVVAHLIRDYQNGTIANAPPKGSVSFVLVGDPLRPNGGLESRLPKIPGLTDPIFGISPEGPAPYDTGGYPVLNVVKEYDIIGDTPADLTNWFSWANALVYAGKIHGDYSQVDLNSPDNQVEVKGDTTYVLVPAKTLPLADAMRAFVAQFGITRTPLIDAAEPVLRYIVDLGYNRAAGQSTPTTFQVGSSIPRFFATLPQFVGAIKQGGKILQSELSLPKPGAFPRFGTGHLPSIGQFKPAMKDQPPGDVPKSGSDTPATSGLGSSNRPKMAGNTSALRPSVKPGSGLKVALDRVHQAMHHGSSSSAASNGAPHGKSGVGSTGRHSTSK